LPVILSIYLAFWAGILTCFKCFHHAGRLYYIYKRRPRTPSKSTKLPARNWGKPKSRGYLGKLGEELFAWRSGPVF
jgi:hypothetical protein